MSAKPWECPIECGYRDEYECRRDECLCGRCNRRGECPCEDPGPWTTFCAEFIDDDTGAGKCPVWNFDPKECPEYGGPLCPAVCCRWDAE